MEQKIYNRTSIIISIIAIVISIFAVSFPYIKEKHIDAPEILIASNKFLGLSHYYGNPFLGLDINVTNTGHKSTVITKIQASLYDAKNDLKIEKRDLQIYKVNHGAVTQQNIVVLNPLSEDAFYITFQLNDIDNDESYEEINKLNNTAVEDLNKQGYIIPNESVGNAQLCDSVYSKVESTCMKNMESLKLGDYKILFFIYQDGAEQPVETFGKSFKITESCKSNMLLSIENYKWGSHLFQTNKILYSQGISIRCYDLIDEDVHILAKKYLLR